ncbi:VTT domain-containing protein [Halomonas sp. NO4]|uniref:VTT domain-containing protein n=1 Tax=Halomonas sp. NO4 TaxID=2484813 RepID=UPI001F0895F0|nr:VTT domain-containing protein [Halomonas sp. NO4]
MKGSVYRRWVAIAAAAMMAGYLWVWYTPDLADVQRWAQQTSEHPATILGVMAIMAITLALGLPASIGLWLIAPFYPPAVAVPMLVLGSLGGALGGYVIARRVGLRWRPGRLTRRVVRLLERRCDVLTQCALRVLPGFPHAVINYAAGLRQLPLHGFIFAAVVGLGIKWAVYANAIYHTLSAAERQRVLTLELLAPLVALSMLLLIGAWARRFFVRGFDER